MADELLPPADEFADVGAEMVAWRRLLAMSIMPWRDFFTDAMLSCLTAAACMTSALELSVPLRGEPGSLGSDMGEQAPSSSRRDVEECLM